MATAQDVRKRAFHYLTPEVAACADMTLAQMQQFIGGTYAPTDEQLRKLANRMGFPPTPVQPLAGSR